MKTRGHLKSSSVCSLSRRPTTRTTLPFTVKTNMDRPRLLSLSLKVSKRPCKVKKIPDIPQKIELSSPQTPTPLSIFFFWNQQSSKNVIFFMVFQFSIVYPKWFQTHPPTFKFCLDVWNFFNFATSLRKRKINWPSLLSFIHFSYH